MKQKYVIIYPWKFVDTLYTIYCLDCFSDETEVLVLDISRVLDREFSDSVTAPATRHNVKKVQSFWQLTAELRKVGKNSGDEMICVNYMVPLRSLTSFIINIICYYYLKGTGVKILTAMNYGMPVFHKTNRKTFLSAAGVEGFSLREFIKKAYSFLWGRLPSPMGRLVTHVLIAGRHNERGGVKEGIKVLKGHCHNYERCLSSKGLISDEGSLTTDAIVFLDTPGPLFGGDCKLTGSVVYKTTEVWYPVLCRFFDQIESMFGAKVVIAAHYKSDFTSPSEVFGGREVFYGCTNELVSKSKLVITEQSSAVAFAVIYKKPVFFIFSDELKNDLVVMRYSDGVSGLLGQPKININQLDSIPSELPEIDAKLYQHYRDHFLSSNPDGPTNAQLIEAEILRGGGGL